MELNTRSLGFLMLWWGVKVYDVCRQYGVTYQGHSVSDKKWRILCVVRGATSEGPVVAFAEGKTLQGAYRNFKGTAEAGKLVWKEDKFRAVN